MTMISASSAVLLAALLTALWRLSLIGQRPKDYPPGPPTLPILGNLHQITKAKRHLQFEKWARQYGPVYSLMLGTKVMIVLNTDDAIRELVDKRGAAYASRPESYIAQDTISGGLRILWMVCQWLCYLLVLVSLCLTIFVFTSIMAKHGKWPGSSGTGFSISRLRALTCHTRT